MAVKQFQQLEHWVTPLRWKFSAIHPQTSAYFVFLTQFLCLLELACILQKLFKLRLTITNFQPGVVMMYNCVRIAQKFSPTSYVYGFGIINLRSFTSISSHCSINGEKNTNQKDVGSSRTAYLNGVWQNSVLSHLQLAQRFYLITVYREQFHDSVKRRL